MALMADTATLVATDDPPNMITAASAATKTAQFICSVFTSNQVSGTWQRAVDLVPGLHVASVLRWYGIPVQ